MAQPKILAFCGSLRTGSLNKRLLLHACDVLKELKCEINYLELRALNLPIYDGDFEDKDGIPAGGQKLIAAINEADALLIASPEYNGGITGALKNAIDWASRADENPFAGKPVLLVGTSSGYWGSVKSNMITRLILTHLRAIVVPTQVTIPNGEESIAENGNLKNPLHAKLVKDACGDLIRFTEAFKK